MTMNKLVLLESVAATVVFVVCTGLLPSLFGLPDWTLPLCFVPCKFYLEWRLKARRWSHWKFFCWVVGMSVFIFLEDRFVLETWRSVLWVVGPFIILSLWSIWEKITKQPLHQVS